MSRDALIQDYAARILHDEGRCLIGTMLADKMRSRFNFFTDKSEINSSLNRARSRFKHGEDYPICWSYHGIPPIGQVAPLTSSDRSDDESADESEGWLGAIPPRAWQVRAISQWEENDCSGVIAAATGTGKSMVGIQAAMRCIEDKGRVLIVVPTIVLLDQWRRAVNRAYGFDVIREDELIGGGYGGSLSAGSPITIGVVNSVINQRQLLANRYRLIVADECHRYGAGRFRDVLDPTIPRRLGLTATLERSDDGVDEVLTPFFGEGLFEYDFAEAREEEVISPFRLALISVELDALEREEYEALGRKMAKAKTQLVNYHGFTPEPHGVFISQLADSAASGGWFTEEAKLAKQYLDAMKQRQEILAETPSKWAALEVIAQAIPDDLKTLVFTQTIKSADQAAGQFEEYGIAAHAYHTKIDDRSRQRLLESFSEGEIQVLVAVKALDEGVDVPDARLGVVVSASRSRRQMIQRIGRVLRSKSDGGEARFVIIYAKNTSEDPYSTSTAEGYIDWLLEGADETVSEEFGPETVNTLLEFLG